MRPIDLARLHGLSSQAIRTYEGRGILPPADRSVGGHRRYGQRHRLSLEAFRALAPALGHAESARLVQLAHQGDVDHALALLDRGHIRLAGDRATLDQVAIAINATQPPAATTPAPTGPLTIGQVAHRIGVTPATLRIWETEGVLQPARDRRSGYRIYRADDLRDAHLARQLRRGHHSLSHIADIITDIREHRSHENLRRALDDWRTTLNAHGLALLHGAAALHQLIHLDRNESL